MSPEIRSCLETSSFAWAPENEYSVLLCKHNRTTVEESKEETSTQNLSAITKESRTKFSLRWRNFQNV